MAILTVPEEEAMATTIQAIEGTTAVPTMTLMAAMAMIATAITNQQQVAMLGSQHKQHKHQAVFDCKKFPVLMMTIDSSMFPQKPTLKH